MIQYRNALLNNHLCFSYHLHQIKSPKHKQLNNRPQNSQTDQLVFISLEKYRTEQVERNWVVFFLWKKLAISRGVSRSFFFGSFSQFLFFVVVDLLRMLFVNDSKHRKGGIEQLFIVWVIEEETVWHRIPAATCRIGRTRVRFPRLHTHLYRRIGLGPHVNVSSEVAKLDWNNNAATSIDWPHPPGIDEHAGLTLGFAQIVRIVQLFLKNKPNGLGIKSAQSNMCSFSI